jgi:hypothetical protein
MSPNKPSPFIDIFSGIRRGFSPFRAQEMVGYESPRGDGPARRLLPTEKATTVRASAPVKKQRTYVLSQDQKYFLEDELKTRALPFSHIEKIKFVEGLDKDANRWTRIAFNKGHEAVTQGNTIYVQPRKFDMVTKFSEYIPFEEVYHTAQFAQDGEDEFYNKYGLSILGGAISGLGLRDGNVQEAFAETEGKKMFEAYRSRQKRERWER